MKKIVLVGMVLGIIFCAVCSSVVRGEQSYGGVIIIAAGRVNTSKLPVGVDAITSATSSPGNTYVFADKLAKELGKLGVQIRIMDFSQCQELETVLPADLIIFASPTYGSKLPKQTRNFLPQIKELAQSKPSFKRIVYSSFTSCKYESSGYKAVNNFLKEIQEMQLRTVSGESFVFSLPEEKLQGKISVFAKELVKAIK